MGSYLPLQRDDPEEFSLDDVNKHPHLQQDEHPDVTSAVSESPRRSQTWTDWLLLLLSLLVAASSCALYASSINRFAPRDARGLRMPDQYPGLEHLDFLAKKKKGPMMIFPNYIIRANKAMPDGVYERGPHVVLSDNDTMFYQWHMRDSKYKTCYIDAVVPPSEELRAANKSYTSSGSLAAIQVWNVTTPTGRLTNLTWNTRPERLTLLGTVAFYPDEERREMLELMDGWQLFPPTPRFACGENRIETFEIVCKGCTLEFDQIFEPTPLAFDLLELG